MDKSNHRITVDREYLEELEKFREENSTDKNARISLRSIEGFSYGLFLEVDTNANENTLREIDTLWIVDKEGRELSRFRKF